MLSLPTITPRADATLWPSLRSAHPTFENSEPSPDNPHQHRRQSSHSHHSHHHHHHASPFTRSLFAQLSSEENNIEQRKKSIQRYGATWIRPPGIMKTYQAIEDEKEEREEQEALARREQIMMDLAAAQQDAANAEARAANGDEMEDGEGERDLDDEVPEAEADESDVSSSVDSASEADEGDTRTGDVTFNEDSFIEGSMVEDQVSHMLAMEEASMSGTLQEERDLDDDIPEAGSYEHTDSSLIDSSSEEEVTQASIPHGSRRRSARRSSGVRRSAGLARVQNSRMSVELEGSSSILEGSSFLRSSPAAARGSLRARFMGARGGRAC